MTPLTLSEVEGRVGSWHYFARYWKRVAIGVAALLVTATLALLVPWLLGRTVTALEGADPAGDIPPLAIAMAAAALGQALIRIVSRVMLFNAAREAEFDLRNDLLANLLRQSPSFYRAHPVGDLMSRLTSDVQTVRAMWGPGILNLVNTAFVFTTALILMVRIDWQLTLIAMLPYPVMFGFGKLFGRRMYRSSRAVQDYLGTMSNGLQEDLTGIGVIKTYNLEPQRTRRFAAMSDELLARNMVL